MMEISPPQDASYVMDSLVFNRTQPKLGEMLLVGLTPIREGYWPPMWQLVQSDHVRNLMVYWRRVTEANEPDIRDTEVAFLRDGFEQVKVWLIDAPNTMTGDGPPTIIGGPL